MTDPANEETFGEAMDRIRGQIDALPWPFSWLMRRRHARLRRRVDRERDVRLARWWTGE